MIKPLNTTQLSSAKPRAGLQSIADLLPRLIQQYEMQAELNRSQDRNHDPRIDEPCQQPLPRQVTFSWYQ